MPAFTLFFFAAIAQPSQAARPPAQPPAQAAADQAYRAKAIEVLRGSINSDDYPTEALARHEEGQVGIRVDIDGNGAVTDCVIERSSGFPALDSQTCRLVWKRAKFPRPVRDGQIASAQTVRTEIQWRMEHDPSPSDPWTVRSIISFANGSASCRLEVDGAISIAKASNAECPGQSDIPPEMAQLAGELITEQIFAMAPPTESGTMKREWMIGRQTAAIEVDAMGKLVTCKISETLGMMPASMLDLCKTVSRKWKPRTGTDGKPMSFRAYVSMAGYLRPTGT